MSRVWRRFAGLGLVVLGVVGSAGIVPEARTEVGVSEAGSISAQEARRRLMGPGRTARFRATTWLERVVAGALVPVIVERVRRGEGGVADLGVVAGVAELGVERWWVEGAEFVVLRELAGRERGTGAYVFRVGGASGGEVILQAPHAWFDVNTGRVAVAMMFDAVGPSPRGLFINTVQRYERGSPVVAGRADVCHRVEHLFSAVTDAAVGALGVGAQGVGAVGVGVIQLHGFDVAGVPAGTRVILSEGLAQAPSERLVGVGARVGAVLGAGVRVYHRDVRRLGGTTNVQARVVARHAGGWFVHVEMAAEVRERLRLSRRLRRGLAGALIGVGVEAAVGVGAGGVP